MSDDKFRTNDGKYPSVYIRDSEEIEALRYLISKGATFKGPDGDPLVEEASLQRLLMLNPSMHFGIKRQEPDPRDKPVSFTVEPVPDNVTQADLRPLASKVEDQGSLGSCFSQAAIGVLELMYTREQKFIDLSRLFTFYVTHKDAGDLGDDGGATIRDVVKSLAKYGTCVESLWNYDVNKAWVEPSKEAYADAATRKIKEYQTARRDVMQVRNLLAMGYPIVCGFDLYQDFLGAKVALTGMVPDPPQGTQSVGAHAMTVVSFDDNKVALNNEMGMFCLRNSWGSNWGSAGYCWVSYRYFNNYAFDCWIILKD